MINKKRMLELLIVVCMSYTAISLLNAGLSRLNGYEVVSAKNEFTIVLWCFIGVSILFTHNLFSKFSPVTTMLIQYTIAISIIMIDIYMSGKFVDLHPDAYKDGFMSFTIPFIIGAFMYYFEVFYKVKKDNLLLQEIKETIKG